MKRSVRRTKIGAALFAGLFLAAGALFAVAALAEPKSAGFSPDPPAQASAKQWVFDVRVQRGKPSIERARSVTLAQPAETARVVGRYAIELWVGPELLDRARFSVPLAADISPDEAERPIRRLRRPIFDDVTTKLRVQMADNPRAAYLVLLDRATGSAERFEWPPPPDGKLIPIRGAAAAPAGSQVVSAGSSAPKPADAKAESKAETKVESKTKAETKTETRTDAGPADAGQDG